MGAVDSRIKQLGVNVTVNGVRQSLRKKGGVIEEFPADLRVREFPR